MLYAIKYYESTSYRELLIDVLSSQHQSLGMKVPERSYWTRFDTDYVEELSVILSQAL
jgi:hypothetical protein